MPTITDIGAIATANLPDGWIASPLEELPGRRSVLRVSPYDATQVTFLSTVRGVELSNPAREAFMQTLYSEFHSLTANEIAKLSEVLEGLANPAAFKVSEAHTTYLNSRRIIRVTGTWTKFKLQETACFVDLTGDSYYIHSLALSAPPREFKQYAEICEKEILLSVTWRTDAQANES